MGFFGVIKFALKVKKTLDKYPNCYRFIKLTKKVSWAINKMVDDHAKKNNLKSKIGIVVEMAMVSVN